MLAVPGSWDKNTRAILGPRRPKWPFACRPAPQEQGPWLTAAFGMKCLQPYWERGRQAGKQVLVPATVPHSPSASRPSCQDPARCPDSRSISANPKLASAAKCSHFTMDGGTAAFVQETGHVCHPLTPFVPAKGHLTIPRNKRREKGWMPWLGLVPPRGQSQSLPKLQPSPSSRAKPSDKS